MKAEAELKNSGSLQNDRSDFQTLAVQQAEAELKKQRKPAEQPERFPEARGGGKLFQTLAVQQAGAELKNSGSLKSSRNDFQTPRAAGGRSRRWLLVRLERNYNQEVSGMEKLDRATHVLQTDKDLGEVQIADEVVAIIAGMAATEVKGVASMAGNIKNELVAKMGMKNLSKGVKVEVTDADVKVDLALNLIFEANILEVSGKVQEKVKSAIESMTGMKVSVVNVRVAGVVLE